ncbi:PEP-CTERM sorting domain-containing protein [Phormidesmis priestleyi ANT.L61.2]
MIPPTSPEGEPIPEPLTILGSGTAIGIAALMQRRRSRKR